MVITHCDWNLNFPDIQWYSVLFHLFIYCPFICCPLWSICLNIFSIFYLAVCLFMIVLLEYFFCFMCCYCFFLNIFLVTSPRSDMWIANAFLPSIACIFIYLTMPLDESKLFIFMKYNLSIFFCHVSCFLSLCKENFAHLQETKMF